MKVNGEVVEEDVVRAEYRAILPSVRDAMPDDSMAEVEARAREWARENVIERVLLRQAAGPDEDGMARLAEKEAGRIGTPREKDINEYFRAHREQFDGREMVRAAHIVKDVEEGGDPSPAETAIRGIYEELLAGADFATLADKYSDCPGNGGDVGFFARGQLVDEFEAVAFSLAPGKFSEPFRSPFGFHIAKVLERRAAGKRPWDEVRPLIVERLLTAKRQKALERVADRLRAAAVIEP